MHARFSLTPAAGGFVWVATIQRHAFGQEPIFVPSAAWHQSWKGTVVPSILQVFASFGSGLPLPLFQTAPGLLGCDLWRVVPVPSGAFISTTGPCKTQYRAHFVDEPRQPGKCAVQGNQICCSIGTIHPFLPSQMQQSWKNLLTFCLRRLGGISCKLHRSDDLTRIAEFGWYFFFDLCF